MEPEEKCCVITWKVENISLCSEKNDELIKSDPFVVDSMSGIQWQLHLYPRGEIDLTRSISDDSNLDSQSTSDESEVDDVTSESTSDLTDISLSDYIGIGLYRKSYISVPKVVEVKFEFAFIGKDGSVLESDVRTATFMKGDCFGFGYFVKQEEVFVTNRSLFLPDDTLTVRCRMWKTDETMQHDVQYFARTKIAVEKGSFMWGIENFSSLAVEERRSYVINSPKNDSPLLTVDCFLYTEENSCQVIRFVPTRNNEHVEYATMKLWLVGASGNKVECNQEEFWFNINTDPTPFTFLFTKEMLTASKRLYLPNDVLSIEVEWGVSKGIEFRRIEKIRDSSEADKKLPHCLLFYSVKSFHEDKFLCDVELKTQTGTFSAHKIILSAYSSVFKSIFSSNTHQEERDCVHIEDLSDVAVKRMLHYIYTSSVEGLTWEQATELYTASLRYAIESLKSICSSHLMENLSTSNAFSVLLLAEEHGDVETKGKVFGFIEKHEKEFSKADWRFLMNSNAVLSAEVLHRLINEN